MDFKSLSLALLGLALLIVLILKLNIDISVLYSIEQPIYILLAFLLTMLVMLLYAYRVNRLLMIVGEPKQDIKELSIIEFISAYIYHITPIRLNIPAKAVMLIKICNVRTKNAISLTTFEFTLDTLILFLIALMGVYVVLEKFLSNPPVLKFATLTFFVFILIFFLIPREVFYSGQKKVSNRYIRMLIRVVSIIRGGWADLLTNKKMYYEIMPLTILIFLIGAIGIEFLFNSYGYKAPITWVIVVTYSAFFIGSITTIPSGLGVREAAMVWLYSELGVPTDTALGVALMSRILITLIIIVGYVLFTTKLSKNTIRKYTKEWRE